MIDQENNNIDYFIGDYLDQLSEATFDSVISEPIDVSVNTQNKIYSLRKNLIGLYISESEKKTADAEQHLNSATKLIEKLVKRDNLNTLILNLHANNEGYSFIINSNPIIQTERLPYEENEFFDYVNNGEIPPIIIDLFDKIKTNIFYDGCIILEIRDYRYCLNNEIKNKLFNTNYSVNYVLLRPSIQSLLADLNNITNDGQYMWTQDDKYELESKLLLLTSEPLCLNPNPIVSVVQSKLNQHKYKLRDRKLKRFAKRQSQPYINRALNYDDYELDYPFHILKIRKNHPLDSKISSIHKHIFPIIEKRNTNWSDQRLNINLPRNDLIIVKKFAKPFEKPKFTNDMTLVPVEEIILEADRNMKNNYSKLVIKRRASDGLYFCSLVLRNEESSEVLFQLGTYNDAEKYVRQYIDIFKEYGRRFVIPKHSVFDNKNYKPILDDATSRLDSGSTGVPFYTLFNSNEIIDKQVQSYYQALTLKLAAKRKSQSDTETQSVTATTTTTTTTVSSPSTPSTPTSSQAITRVYANIQPAKVPLISKLNDVSQQPKVFKIDSNNSPKTTKIETIPSNKIVTTTTPTSSQMQLQNLNKLSLNTNNIIQIHLPKLINSSSSTANNSISQNENKIITTTTTSINGTSSASQQIQQTQQPKIQLVTINNPTTAANTLGALNEKKVPKKRIIKKTINTTATTTTTNKSGPQLTQATLINASNLNLLTKSVQPQKLTIKTIPASISTSGATSSTPTINLVGVNQKAQSPLRVNANHSTIFTTNKNTPQTATTSNSSQLLNNLLTNNCAAVQLNLGSNASNTPGPIIITSSSQNPKVSTTPIQSQQSQLPKLAAASTTSQSQSQGIVLPSQLFNAIISPGTSSSSTAIANQNQQTPPIVTPRRPGRPRTVLSADSIKNKQQQQQQQQQQTTQLNKRQKKNSIS